MSLVSKKVQIEFASPRIQAVEAIYDIRKAAESAGLNLFSRYDVQLQMPMVSNGKVIVEVKIPTKIAGSFSFGRRLRGISAYLLRYCDGRYDQYLVGDRLLTYTEVSEQEEKSEGIPVADRFEAIADFSRLMERNDEDAMDQISRIIVILNEGK